MKDLIRLDQIEPVPPFQHELPALAQAALEELSGRLPKLRNVEAPA